jgi:simple sugar transport system ATP-binding protein
LPEGAPRLPVLSTPVSLRPPIPFLTLQAIAAAVIGGTSLLGGSGTVIGSLIGAFVVATLNNGLSGFHRPDSGTTVYHGKEVHFGSPRDARAHGIQTVYQDLALIGDLSVYHNMFLRREYHKRILGVKLLDNRKMRDLAKTYLDTLGIEIPSVNSTVDLLSGGQRQSIAVARSIYSSPTVLVLDEPLAALGVREGAHVLGLIQNLRRQRKVSIILTVHNYNQVFEVCDRINFLHGGEIVLDASTSETTEEELIRIVKSGLGHEAIAAAASEVQRQMGQS